MKRIILFLSAIFAFVSLVAGIRADVKDDFSDICSSTITKALVQAKTANKKVLVYFIPARDSSTNYDYDRILFSYPDFVTEVKNFIIVREWAARPKDRKYSRMAEIRTMQAGFVFLDPNDDKFSETLLIFNGAVFANEEDVVRKMIEVSAGAE